MSRLNGSTLKVSGFLDEFEKDDVKRSVDIVNLFGSFGIELSKKGKSYMGLCPFHEDKSPSLSVDRDKGLFHCFGCGESGDIFDLVMKLKGYDFKESLAYLKKGTFPALSVVPVKPLEAKLPEVEPAEEKSSVPEEKEQPAFPSVSLDAVSDYYQKALGESKEAREYLESRKLWNPEILTALKVGYASGDLKTKLSDKQYNNLKEAGIFTDKGRESFAGCIVFPLLDETGRVVSFYGRKIGKSTVNHLYLKGPHKGLINLAAFKAWPEQMIFTESVIDAVSLIIMGFQNVTACYGTNGVTSDHYQALKDNRTKEIVIAFDSDNAGIDAAEDLAGKLLKEGYSVRTVYPHAEQKDWNASLLAGFTKQQFEEFLNDSLRRDPEGKNRLRIEEKDGKYTFITPQISYRVVGVKEGFVSSLKVNVRAEKEDEKHIDNVDLFSARSRSSYSLQLGRLFEVESARVENDLVSILEWLEDERDRKLLGQDKDSEVSLSSDEEAAGMDLLKDPEIFNRIESDLSALGYVGERTNKLLMYLAASSRKLNDPISVIVISQSAAGKSYLIDTVKKLIPDEDVLSMTSLSDQALNYLPDEALLHKFLVMGEAVHSDVIDHQMREMLSGKELSRLVTVKDDKTGRMVSRLVRKKVIVSAVMSSTSNEINPENASRCFVISTDETEEQTKAIHRQQRQKYSLQRFNHKEVDIPAIKKAHFAAQRLLKDRIIVNRFADVLDFPATLMRSRRDHERFIDLIACVCFLRQYQKEERTEEGKTFIECDLEDYKTAYEIMVKILPSTLSNFPRSAQLFYEQIRTVLREKAKQEELSFHEVSVSQRELREKTGASHDVVKWNLRHLCEYEYVRKVGGYRRGQSGHYRIEKDESIDSLISGGIPTPEELEQSGVKWGNKK